MSRIEKVNEMMKREISVMLLQELRDPRLMFVTVTDVEVSRDLQHARVFYSVLGNEQKLAEVEDALHKAKGYVRRFIGQRITLRYTPEIDFVYDKTVQYSDRIEQTLQDIKNQNVPKAEEE